MRSGVRILLLAYVGLSIPMLLAKGRTFDEVAVFSQDEVALCRGAGRALNDASMLVSGCNPFPYGQLYTLLVSGPLLLLKQVMPISEAMVINWAVILLIAFGAVVLGATYKVCACLYPSPYPLLVTVLVFLTPEFWRWSNEIHPDMPQLAFMLVGFYFAVRLWETATAPQPRPFLYLTLASLFAGLAMATKFNGLFLLPVILVAYNRPFLQGLWKPALPTFIIRNLQYGTLCLLTFAFAFFLFNPCFLFNSDLVTEPFTRATRLMQGEAGASYSLGGRAAKFAHSNYIVGAYLVGFGMYPAALAGMIYGLWRLARRHAEEIGGAHILVDVFLIIFLVYSLGFGYGLVNGRLMVGYERYLLPALPLLYISAMRIVAASKRLPRMVAVAFVGLLLVGQADMIRSCYRGYVSRYFQKDKGYFKVYAWVQEHIPADAVIYTEEYIHVPMQDYRVTKHYVVHRRAYIESSDFVITKTLNYEMFSNPERWEFYKGPKTIEARHIYKLLDRGLLPPFKKVVALSSGDRFNHEDMVVVYQNCRRVPGPACEPEDPSATTRQGHSRRHGRGQRDQTSEVDHERSATQAQRSR